MLTSITGGIKDLSESKLGVKRSAEKKSAWQMMEIR
jgi:hypothetical protein